MESDRISLTLNNNAWTAFEKSTDKKVLQDALNWSKRSLEIAPDNSMILDTYANLLYKLGQNEEAIKYEELALSSDAKKGMKTNEGKVETLRKMKAGEKTWKEL